MTPTEYQELEYEDLEKGGVSPGRTSLMDRLAASQEVIMLDYDEKQKLLDEIIQRMLALRLEFVQVSREIEPLLSRQKALRSEQNWLVETKSALQSALRAERDA